MITMLQRKVMQLYRFSLNKIIYRCNEPIKLQDAQIQAEPQQSVKIKNLFQQEQNIKRFEEQQQLKVLFQYFDNMVFRQLKVETILVKKKKYKKSRK
ncbi:hypothetical protein FGO68_gene9585 [Halteria grandinella]|uniref:Uncharacterized protein n=1 Tax=Halteria grandinella TaxID=5974 RepID=A0A8J8NGY8_HALGN|nr:hypothetical protein FGO68_gene9585 [Halteria grandinella]